MPILTEWQLRYGMVIVASAFGLIIIGCIFYSVSPGIWWVPWWILALFVLGPVFDGMRLSDFVYRKKYENLNIAIAISAIALVFTAGPLGYMGESILGYSYYTLLRIGIFSVCIWAMWQCVMEIRLGWFALLICITVLFRPIYPVHMEKEVWLIIDICAGLVLFAFRCSRLFHI